MASRTRPTQPAEPTEPAPVEQIDIVGFGERFGPVFGGLANLRAIPDARDGLIPVRRRVVYVAHDTGLTSSANYRKSATVVGEVMGHYHPHGDTSIYGSLVLMAQGFALRYPLIDGSGNFGSIDGDPAAAMRYSEARLSPMGDLLCRDLFRPQDEVIDWAATYNNERQEPMALPARFPVLLANGHIGVGWGDACSVLPHNLRELIDAACALIDDPELATPKLAKHLPGPDFPTGAILVENDEWERILEEGRGKVTVRARMHTEPASWGRRQTTAIVVDELPYQVQKGKGSDEDKSLIKKIETLTNDGGELAGIVADVRDESAGDVRLVITLDPGVEPERGLHALLAATKVSDKGPGLQKTFNVNSNVIVGGLPERHGTRGLLRFWIDHQMDLLTRRTRYFLRRDTAALQIERAKEVAHENAEALVRLVKASGSEAEIVDGICAKYRKQLDPAPEVARRQAQYIANLPLKTYGRMSMDSVHKEVARLTAAIAEWNRLLATRKAMEEQLKLELREIRAKFGDDRRTTVDTGVGAAIKSAEELIPDAPCWVAVTESGLVARYPESAFRATKRNTAGVNAAAKPDEDPIVRITGANARDRLYLLTDKGNLFGLRAAELEETTRGAKGTNVRRYLSLAEDERVSYVLPVPADGAGELVLATVNGKVLRTRLSDYANLNSAGLKAINLLGDDTLVAVRLAKSGDELITVTSDGYAARYDIDEVSINGRGSQGVASVKLGPGATVVSLDIVAPTDKRDLAVVLSNGKGKRSRLLEYPVKGRAIRGVTTADLGTASKGAPVKVVFAAVVAEPDELMFTTSAGKAVVMEAKEIKRQGRATAGILTVKLSESKTKPETVTGGSLRAG